MVRAGDPRALTQNRRAGRRRLALSVTSGCRAGLRGPPGSAGEHLRARREHRAQPVPAEHSCGDALGWPRRAALQGPKSTPPSRVPPPRRVRASTCAVGAAMSRPRAGGPSARGHGTQAERGAPRADTQREASATAARVGSPWSPRLGPTPHPAITGTPRSAVLLLLLLFYG